MSCLILIGGGIGCGKTALLKYLHENKCELFCKVNSDGCKDKNCELLRFSNILLDDLFSLQDQEKLMKTVRGWRDFRVDLLMAAEHFINENSRSENSLNGPLSKRSHELYTKLLEINIPCDQISNCTVYFVEDNFYYRSMRYNWLQISRRNNLGFAQIFVFCPLSTALHRNSTRGYCIPEEKLKQMLSFFEYPDPVKYKWEKYSCMFDSSEDLKNSNLNGIVDVIKKAQKNPIESVILEEKFDAQRVCSKNLIHQADKIIRKLVSREISKLKDKIKDDDLKMKVPEIIRVRQKLLCDIKQGLTVIPGNIVEQIENTGIDSVSAEFEDIITELFLRSLTDEIGENFHLSSLRIAD